MFPVLHPEMLIITAFGAERKSVEILSRLKIFWNSLSRNCKDTEVIRVFEKAF
jgi:hypothetical protein